MPEPAPEPLTFLFTDLEGSSRLWEEHPDAMREALVRHDRLLRSCIEGHGGRVFKTMGDAFFAAFPEARRAVEAAVAAQLELAAVRVSTPEGELPLKVRMALHTGPAEELHGGYFGATVNRAARLVPVGHGGQVLLSGAAYAAVGDRLPPETAVNDMGPHRLKDLDGAERIFQLWHPELQGDFPPLRSLDNPLLKHNLRRQLTRFIGREKDLAAVRTLVDEVRLLTLTGPGGTGKTRLALQLAADLVGQSEDGVWFTELAALADPALVPAAVAAALGLREVTGNPILETLVEHLKGKRVLLVLDNCEHLLEACARFVDALLREASQLRVLATSREPLGTYGETVYRVPSLTLPDPVRDVEPHELNRYEAVRLFRERAVQVQPGFEITRGNGPALASVCVRLDGIPLALELAAARVRSLTLEEIDRGLDQRFQLLTGGARAALPRQQTLQSLIDWSYDLLNPVERILLDRASVFAGGWTLEAAEAVCAGERLEDWEVLDVLTSLADKSLVTVAAAEGTTRYGLLETVRQYAAERLAEKGQAEAWRRRHLEYFTGLARAAESHLGGPEQKRWLEQLDPERANLRAALEWSAAHNPDAGLEMIGLVWRFWDLRGHVAEGRNLVTALLAASDAEKRTADRARALHTAGLFAFRHGDFAAAQARYEESLEIAREVGDPSAVASALNQLGNVAWMQGDYPTAQARHEESLQLRKELGDRRGVGASLNNLGNLAQRLSDLAAARACLEECLEITREFGDQTGIAITLNNLGNTVRLQGDADGARRMHEECLRIRRELGDPVGIASSLNNLAMALHDLGELAAARALLQEGMGVKQELGDRQGIAQSLGNQAEIAYDLGDYSEARTLYLDALQIFLDLGDPWAIAGALEGLAGLAGLLERPDGLDAARIAAAAATLREEIGAPVPAHEVPRYERQLAQVRAALGDEAAFNLAWEEGSRLSAEEAGRLALAVRPPESIPKKGAGEVSGRVKRDCGPSFAHERGS